MDRLNRALDEFHIAFQYSPVELVSVVEKLNEAAGGGDGYFRLNVSGVCTISG